MRVFVTGAPGWIGSAVVDELLAAGHEVVGLARSDVSTAALQAKGVDVRRGDLDDLDGIRAGALDAEAIVHLANKHDWSNPAASNAAERAAVQTIAEALVGTGRPFLLASGVAALAQGRPATEADASPFHGPDSPRGGAENLAFEFVDRGVHTNRWAAVHRTDAARMVALGLAKAPAGTRLHAVAEEGIPTRVIAEAIGRAFVLDLEAGAYR